MQDPIECVIIWNMPGQGRESIHLIGIMKVVMILVTSDIRVDGIEEHQQVTQVNMIYFAPVLETKHVECRTPLNAS